MDLTIIALAAGLLFAFRGKNDGLEDDIREMNPHELVAKQPAPSDKIVAGSDVTVNICNMMPP